MSTTIPDIRFYSFDFELLHVENQFLSSNWSIYYNDIGTFEAHFDLESDTLPIVMDNDYLIVVQGDLSAIVVGKSLGNDLAVYGRTCNWLLTKRVTNEFNKEMKTIYEWVTGFIEEAFEDSPVIADSKIVDTAELEVERSNKGETFKLVQEVLAQDNLGHDIQFDFAKSQFLFQVLKGSKNPLVISTVNRNAYDVTVNSDILDVYTEGLYKPKTEDWQREIKETPENNLLKWVGILSGESESEASASLAKARKTSNIQGKTVGVRFGYDYALGDTVTVQYQAGDYKHSACKRIIGVNLWYETGNIGEEPIFEDVTE